MRQLWSLLVAAMVCAATVDVAAQAPEPNSAAPQAPATSAQQPRSSPATQAPSTSLAQTAKTVTFSGCIEKAPAESDAAAPAAGAAPRWVLTNASSTAAGGAVGTAGAARPATRYRLDADEAKIGPHAGHKVEVTGTLEEQSGSASSAPGGAIAPTLKVSAVKMVAAICP